MSLNQSLAGSRIVVVGASSGTGRAVARHVSEMGAQVFLLSRSKGKLEAVRATLPGPAVTLAMDMLNEASVADTFERIGSFDHLVVTAVADENKLRSPIGAMSTETATRGMEKFWGSFFVCRAAAQKVSKAGSITLTSSVSIFKPSATGGVSVMSAASGAVATFGRTLAAELAPVRVNVIAPGVVNSGVWDSSTPEQRAGMKAWAESSLPVRHLGEPEEVAGAFVALMLNPYITGALLPVDGGLSLT